VLFAEPDSGASFDRPEAPSPAELPPPSPAELPPPSLDLVEPEEPSPDPVAAAAFVFELLDDRSFLAQPEPLKWTVGAANTLRSVSSAPQAGQKRGVGASMPWMNSVRVEQLEQT
jgi:hypothetical protein